MNTIIKSTLLALVIFSLAGCSKFLDQVPSDRITIEQVFQKKGPSEQYLANIYTYVNDDASQWEGVPWGANADEMDMTWSKYPTYALNIGNISAGNALFDRWPLYYRGIRSATYFINNIDGNAEILSLNGKQLIDQ
jgi:hypothetical protein